MRNTISKFVNTLRKNDKFKENGITLVALIVTIVVLIILAVISIRMIFSEDGIIKRAEQSSIIQELKQVEEQVKIRLNEERINKTESKEEYDISSYTSLDSFSPKIESKYSEYIRIENGELYIKLDAPEEIKSVAESIGMQAKNSITNIRIYGDSIQDGTPTPENPVEIKSVGEKTINMLPYPYYEGTKTTNGVTITVNKDGTLTYNGTAQGGSVNINLFMGKMYLEEGVTYYIYDVNAQLNGIGGNNISGSYTAQKGDYISLLWKWAGEGTVFNNVTYSPVLSTIKISNKEQYEPYGYKIPVKVNSDTEIITTNIYLKEPLRKVGDKADYIDFKTERVVRNIGKYNLTGSESWQFYKTDRISQFYFQNTGIGGHSANETTGQNIISNYYKGDRILNRNGNYGTIYSYASGIAINDDRFGTIEEFKEYIENIPIEIYYQLITPTEEAIVVPEISTLRKMTSIHVETQTQPSKIDIIE